MTWIVKMTTPESLMFLQVPAPVEVFGLSIRASTDVLVWYPLPYQRSCVLRPSLIRMTISVYL